MSFLENLNFKKIKPFILPAFALFLIINANLNNENTTNKKFKITKGPSYSVYPSKGKNWSYVYQQCMNLDLKSNGSPWVDCFGKEQTFRNRITSWSWMRIYPRKGNFGFPTGYTK